jgi:imidazolonepropionase-like amidohydrolase
MPIVPAVRVAAVCALGVAILCTSCGGRSTQRTGTLITARRVFDGRAFHSPGRVLVRGGRIAAVDPSGVVHPRRTIALGDATILPGFVDLHVHGGAGMVDGGVTTVRNLGAPLAELHRPFRVGGLRVLMAGPLISVAGGYPETVWGPSIALDVRGPADARRAVRMLARRGAAVIKIALDSDHGEWPMLTVAEVRTIVSEAHRLGLRVTAHAMWRDGVGRALAGGVDELAHTPCGATPGLVHTIVARRIPVVSTLHVEQLVRGGCLDVARAIVRAGGTLLYGTDEGNAGIPASIDVTELRLMRAAGLSPTAVLEAATREAASDLGLAPLGALAPGAPADLIVVRGDARALRSDLAAPLLVMSDGRIVVRRSG